MRKLFLLFCVKRKLKLMSLTLNSQESPSLEMRNEIFMDVIKNDALDMAVLLYREFFLILKENPSETIQLLITCFEKANGNLESKCYLIRRYIKEMSY